MEAARIQREGVVPKVTWQEQEELAVWRPTMDDLNPSFSRPNPCQKVNRAVLVVVVVVAVQVAYVQAGVVVPADGKDPLEVACRDYWVLRCAVPR